MKRIGVWCPSSQQVAVDLKGRSVPLESGGNGWWHAPEDADPSGGYAFRIDASKPLPDPRSLWQPNGPHACSFPVNHAAYEWHDHGFRPPPLTSAVIYELHIGTFTPGGTFLSGVECLNHLVDLGVTHVELMPVQEFSGAWGWGYDGVDLYAPHHHYGTPDDLKTLVDACHARGLAVLLDVVYNHLGPSGNYLAQFGPYFTDRYTTPWGPALNLDGRGSREVRRYLCDNALMWLRDYHFDGLRLDAIHTLLDTSATHFLEQLAREVETLSAQLGRSFVLIAESDLNDPKVVTSFHSGGYGIDAQWSDDFHHSLHTVLTGERNGYYCDFGAFDDLAKALRQAFVYDGRFSEYRNRFHGRDAGNRAGHRFLAYMQNHDQIGNRAQGERSSALLSTGRLKIAAALVLTSPFVPMLFMGEEWAASTPFLYFSQHEEESFARMVTEGRTREFLAFGWEPKDVLDPQAPSTFEASKLRWEERHSPRGAEMLEWHKRLIELRRRSATLLDGRMRDVRTSFDAGARWFRMDRTEFSIAFNIGPGEVCIPASGELMMASESGVRCEGGSLRLPSDSVAILSQQTRA